MDGLFAFTRRAQAALDYHVERHTVLASNLAHVETPGYVPRDLRRTEGTDFSQTLQIAMERTNPLHAAGAPSTTAKTGEVFQDPSASAGNDGNYVSLDREAGKVAANQLRYEVISTILRDHFAGLEFAAGDGRGA